MNPERLPSLAQAQGGSGYPPPPPDTGYTTAGRRVRTKTSRGPSHRPVRHSVSPGLAWGGGAQTPEDGTEGHTGPGLLSTPGSLRVSNRESHVPPDKSEGSLHRTPGLRLRSLSASAEYRDRPLRWSSTLEASLGLRGPQQHRDQGTAGARQGQAGRRGREVGRTRGELDVGCKQVHPRRS